MKDLQLFGITLVTSFLLVLMWFTDHAEDLGRWADRRVDALDALFDRVRRS